VQPDHDGTVEDFTRTFGKVVYGDDDEAILEALPLPHPGADLLDEVRAFVQRFVAFPTEHCLVAVVLWAAHAHAVLDGENSPRLAVLSPEPGSGKTRVLEVLELLVPSPMFALSASTPAIFRSLAATQRTLLFDEVDAIFGRHGKDDSAEDLRALLNAGHRRGATIPRCVGPAHDVKEFPVFAAVAMAGLGDAPDTLMSRSVVIRMRRRLTSERVEPFRRRLHEQAGTDLRERLTDWCENEAARIGMAWPEMPDGVSDRPADVWEPLLAIADSAGGHWPETARAACIELVKVVESREASLGIKLLADLRTVFGITLLISTETILSALCAIEESPWSDLRGKAIDPRGLARRLKQYGISSTKVRIGETTLQGYRREDLSDAWSRYLPPTPGEVEQVEHPEQSRSQGTFSVPDEEHVPEHVLRDVPDVPARISFMELIAPPLTRDVPDVPLVPDMQTPGSTDYLDRDGCPMPDDVFLDDEVAV
jgi:hypothetical protein